ncbi:MAG: S-layer homology domain-containing protein [Clostridia bacterium]|nr:S-layer homology domain-containing protein [Clostridia bacterium]
MKKRILAIMLAALLSFAVVPAWAEELSNITAVDGNVNISATINAAEGTPVLIFIMPAVIENDVDVTVQKIKGLTSKEVLSTLTIEYAAVVNAGENGQVSHTCNMKDNLATGLCHVIFSYLGSDGCYSMGTFEHVGKDDMNSLVSAFNGSSDNYASIIDEDMNGKDGEPAKEILRKSSADVAYYKSLSDKTEFHSLLYKLKGNEDFTLATLVSAFNETGAWIRLQNEADTLSVLTKYNGEELYWNVDLDADSDFAKLSNAEKTKLLAEIKAAKHSDKESLEDAFLNAMALAMFRESETREDIIALISEESAYAEIFTGVRAIIADAELDEYNEALMYNNVLDGAAACTTLEGIEELFESLIPEEDDGYVGGGNGGSSGGSGGSSSGGGRTMGATGGYVSGGSTGKNLITDNTGKLTLALPFADISDDHWAKSYIEKLYDKGTVNGVSDKEFAPGGSVQRQDFVKIMIGALDLLTSGNTSIFTDCPDGVYYTPYVMAAYKKGLISGIDEGIFGAGVSIKREDAAVIIDRVLTMYNFETSEEDISFSDADVMADYAKDAVIRVAKAGIFNGDEQGNFNPKADLSRAEACAILCRLAEKVKGV